MKRESSSSPSQKTGHENAGRRHTGRVTRTRNSAPSIPSKFETILFHGQKEVKGFISGAVRFRNGFHDEGPGPGAYDSIPRKSTESFSKKGFGNLASSAGRFQNQRPNYYPGPSTPHKVIKSASSSKRILNHRNVFSSTVPRIPHQRTNANPPPGHYNLPKTHTKVYIYREPAFSKRIEDPDPSRLFGEKPDDHSGPSSPKVAQMPVMKAPFGVCDNRFSVRKSKKSPAPGQYNPQLPHNPQAARNAFKSRCERQVAPTVSPNDFMLQPHFENNPGPGTYGYGDIDRSNQMKLSNPTRNFIDRTCDRFGNPLQRKSKMMLPSKWPGPGHYNPSPIGSCTNPRPVDCREQPKFTETWVSTVRAKMKRGLPPGQTGTHTFKSKSPSVEVGKVKNSPGPAYYKRIEQQRRISHHRGNAKTWSR